MAIDANKQTCNDHVWQVGENTRSKWYWVVHTVEPCAEVGIEKIQQTTTSLQVTVLDAQYEYFTHVEDDDDDDDDDDDNDDDDDDYVDETAINGEDFVDRDEYEERIE